MSILAFNNNALTKTAYIKCDLPFACDNAVVKARGPIVTDHAHHWLILFVGLLHLMVRRVDGRRLVIAIRRGHRPPGSPRVGRQVERVHLMRGGHGQLR